MELEIFLTMSAFLLIGPVPLDLVGFIIRYPADGLGGACGCDGALVAVDTEIVPDLQMQRSVAEGRAPLYAFGTAYAQLLIDDIFKIGLLNKPALNGGSGT